MFEQVTNPKQNTDLKHLARVQSLTVTSRLWRQLRSPDNTPPPTTTTTTVFFMAVFGPKKTWRF
jgi:hypothetical protein